VRILHTADWHLGQALHGVARTHEHARFLAWLERTLEAEDVDALIIAGDVFDTANPGPHAQAMYYELLAGLRRRLPHLEIVVVGGNHDSPQRLDAPAELLALDAIRISVVGGLPRRSDGAVDLDRVLVPLRTRDRNIGAWVIAVPFLRRGDLPLNAAQDADVDSGVAHERLIEAYRALYRQLVDAAKARRAPGQALIATGHCYMVGGRVSELSERKVQVGNQHALPLDVFPGELAYVALGHLHHAQSVLGRENVRYSGSPIPLSLAERTYEHQVLLIDVEGERLRAIRKLPVPRVVEMSCVPEEHAPLETVLELLRALPRAPASDAPPEERPYLEVRVLLDSVAPRLRRDIESALEGAWARLVRIDARYRTRDGLGEPLAEVRDLDSIAPEDVFRACYARQRAGAPPEDLLSLFAELFEEAKREEETGA
jgi:DNA repair protein SbcD/Mre11